MSNELSSPDQSGSFKADGPTSTDQLGSLKTSELTNVECPGFLRGELTSKDQPG